MTAELAIEKTGRVSYRYSVTVTVSQAGAVAEWYPRTPKKLRSCELTAYRAVRDAAIAELAEHLGLIMVADTDGRIAVLGR
ncbi:MAG: hypothetical protein ACYDBH_13225 [Acidobacteriaceae bacterium]